MLSLSDIETNAEHPNRASLTLSSGVGLVAFNRIYRTMAAALPWPELRESNSDISTTAGIATYDWPEGAQFLTLEAVEIQDGDDLDKYKLVFQPPDTLEWNLAAHEENEAVPSYYLGKVAASGGQHEFELRPAPKNDSKTVRMTGIPEPEEAVDGDSVTVFKLAAADDVLAYLIAADFLDRDGITSFADRQLGKAKQLIVRMFGEEHALVAEQIIRGG